MIKFPAEKRKAAFTPQAVGSKQPVPSGPLIYRHTLPEVSLFISHRHMDTPSAEPISKALVPMQWLAALSTALSA